MNPSGRAPLRVPGFVVVSGGAIGDGYVRQLLQAVAAGALETERIVVVDRDPGCPAGRHRDPRVVLERAEWVDWLDVRLDAFGPDAQLVPYHWAPHLLADYLARQVARARGRLTRLGPPSPPGVPYERPTRDGDLALSYATWTCPPTCIEPALCPHTRGAKDWSLAADLQRPRREPDEPLVFRSLHLVWGVATIPVGAILDARDRVLAGLGSGPRRYLVATASHCHGLAAHVEVAPLEGAPG